MIMNELMNESKINALLKFKYKMAPSTKIIKTWIHQNQSNQNNTTELQLNRIQKVNLTKSFQDKNGVIPTSVKLPMSV